MILRGIRTHGRPDEPADSNQIPSSPAHGRGYRRRLRGGALRLVAAVVQSGDRPQCQRLVPAGWPAVWLPDGRPWPTGGLGDGR